MPRVGDSASRCIERAMHVPWEVCKYGSLIHETLISTAVFASPAFTTITFQQIGPACNLAWARRTQGVGPDHVLPA